jgi:hypothetical protein
VCITFTQCININLCSTWKHEHQSITHSTPAPGNMNINQSPTAHQHLET